MSFTDFLRNPHLACTFLLGKHNFKESNTKEHKNFTFLSKLHSNTTVLSPSYLQRVSDSENHDSKLRKKTDSST